MSTGELSPIPYHEGTTGTATLGANQVGFMEVSALPEAPDILEVRPIDLTNPEDAAFLRDAYELFVRHGMLNRLGLWLIHRHKQIQVGPGESMVEYTDSVNQQQIVRPTLDSAIDPKNVIQTLFQFASGEIEPGATPVLACASRCAKFEDAHVEVAHLPR